MHPEELVISSGCGDVAQPAGRFGGVGWFVVRHRWQGCREFWVLGKEEEEKEGARPGEEINKILNHLLPVRNFAPLMEALN